MAVKCKVVVGAIVVVTLAVLGGLTAAIWQGYHTAGYVGQMRVDRAELALITRGKEGKDEAWKEIVLMKAEQALFAENGICDPFNYQKFTIQLEEENRARRQAVSQGEVIYGPKEYKAEDYYRYQHSIYRLALQKLWMDELERKIDKNQLLESYLMLRDERFVKREAGILELLETVEGPVIQVITVESTVPKMQSAEQKAYRSLLETISVGAVVEVEIGGVSQLIRCASKKPRGYFSFEEVRNSLQRDALEAQYQACISAKASSLKVQRN